MHVLHAKHPYLARRFSRALIVSIDFAVLVVPQVLAILVPELTWMLYVALGGVMVMCLALAVPYVICRVAKCVEYLTCNSRNSISLERRESFW